MTIYETIKSPEEVKKENKREYMKEYRAKNRKRLNRYQSRYYHTNRDYILNKKLGFRYRRCFWCGQNIDHINPRNVKFCNNEHERLYRNKKKREYWRDHYGKMSKVQKVQPADMPAPEQTEDRIIPGGGGMPAIPENTVRRDPRY